MPNINPIILAGSGGGSTAGTYFMGSTAEMGRINEIQFDMVSFGATHAVGIKDGKLYTWGLPNLGALGNNITNNQAFISFSPIQIGTDTNWTHCSAGNNFTAGIKGGQLWVWGLNGSGQLGLGDTTTRLVPTQVGSDTNWSWVNCGAAHTMAIKGGQLWTAGSNGNGRTGLATQTGNTTTFTQVGSATDWSKVYAGSAHTIAIKSGQLWTWGNGTNGRLGLGNTTTFNTPQQVGSDTDWSIGAAGDLHSGAIKTNGTLWMWGLQLNGRLGNNVTSNSNQTTPVQIGTDTDWQHISLTSSSAVLNAMEFSLALKANRAWGAGLNSYRQISNDLSITQSGVFIQITTTNTTGVSAGAGAGMYILS
jgi:alpha-tubulin suppressor-like RCC1 family protein